MFAFPISREVTGLHGKKVRPCLGRGVKTRPVEGEGKELRSCSMLHVCKLVSFDGQMHVSFFTQEREIERRKRAKSTTFLKNNFFETVERGACARPK